jgi:hypothetical protein
VARAASGSGRQVAAGSQGGGFGFLGARCGGQKASARGRDHTQDGDGDDGTDRHSVSDSLGAAQAGEGQVRAGACAIPSSLRRRLQQLQAFLQTHQFALK